MRGTVQIGDKAIDMVANGATPFIYKRVFRRDFLATTQTEDMNVYSELAFVMAMQAEKPMSELLNNLTADFSSDEQSRLYRILHRNEGIAMTPQSLREFIGVIQGESQKPSDKGAMTTEQINTYFDRIRRNKQ